MQLIKDYRVLVGLQPGAAVHLAVATLIEQYASMTQKEQDSENKDDRIAYARTAAVKHIVKGVTYHLDDDNFIFQRPLEIALLTGLEDLAEFYGRCVTQNLASTQDLLRTLVDTQNPYRQESNSNKLIATTKAIALVDNAWNDLKGCYEVHDQYRKRR